MKNKSIHVPRKNDKKIKQTLEYKHIPAEMT